jgi:hypothetical protein
MRDGPLSSCWGILDRRKPAKARRMEIAARDGRAEAESMLEERSEAVITPPAQQMMWMT